MKFKDVDYIQNPLYCQVNLNPKKMPVQNINITQMAARLGLDPEQYRELIELFIENTGTELSQIRKALRENDLNQVSNLVHSFRGAAANLGLYEIAAKGEALGYAIRNKRYLEIEQLLDEVLHDMNTISQSI